VPVAITLDSCGKPRNASNAAGCSFSETTPCINPVPSRKIGKSSLPDSRML
jgi:hypothetical protein